MSLDFIWAGGEGAERGESGSFSKVPVRDLLLWQQLETLYIQLLPPFRRNNTSTFPCRGSFCYHGIVPKLAEHEF
jgi:hypothetical protein